VERLGAERFVVALSLAGVVALAWLYLWRQSAAMPSDMAMEMSGMPAMDSAGVALVFAMWLVMMAGMMLPGAAPMVLLYGAMVRKHSERGSVLPAVWIFVSGYLLVWAGFSLAAALLQALLDHAALLSPAMTSSSKPLSSLLLAAAGVYQLTPLKDRCLRHCREPVQFLMTHWRPGPVGALRMGLVHGAYCVGCCWMLMLLLFAVGVMNLAWVAAIAAFVLVEKLLPGARFTSRFAGAALLVLAGATLL
jgi:predicted metal-binding membrane protein